MSALACPRCHVELDVGSADRHAALAASSMVDSRCGSCGVSLRVRWDIGGEPTVDVMEPCAGMLGHRFADGATVCDCGRFRRGDGVRSILEVAR